MTDKRQRILDIVVALLLWLWAAGLVTDRISSPGRHGGVGAAIAVALMTVPVAWRRSAPDIAALTLFIGAIVNELGVGGMVRCGPCLPALFLVGYSLGRHRATWRSGLPWCLALAGSAFLQVHYDPNLRSGGIPFSVVLSGICVVFWAAGRYLRSRTMLTAALSTRTEELERQREDNARLAVAADRSRIADNVNQDLDDQLASVIDQARRAATIVHAQPHQAAEAFVEIQQTARDSLGSLRRSLHDVLDENAPRQPAPVLAELTQLLDRSDGGSRQLLIEGDPQSLPSGIELSAYRIVERLLNALDRTPDAHVEICVRFEPGVLEIALSTARHIDLDAELVAAVAAASERAALHGGTLIAEPSTAATGWSARTCLPLAVAAS